MDKEKADNRVSELTVALAGIKRTITKLSKDTKTLLDKPQERGEEDLFKHKVQQLLEDLRAAKARFVESSQELGGLFDYLTEALNSDQTVKQKALEEAIIDYDTKYQEAHDALFKAHRSFIPPPEPAAVAAATTSDPKWRWKPKEEYKPITLQITDRPTVLDAWIMKLTSHVPGIDDQPYNDVYNIITGLMSEQVASAAKISPHNKMRIFKKEGEDSLVDRLEKHWKWLYPLNRLRMSILEMKSDTNETWDTWEHRMEQEAAKAELSSMTGDEIRSLLTVMNYQGRHAEKIRSELAKISRKGEERKEVSIDAARDIFNAEDYATRLGNPSTVKQLNQRGQGNSSGNGKGQGPQSSNRGKGSSGNSNPKGQGSQSGSGKSRFVFSEHVHAKSMKAQNRCYSCFQQGCPATAGKKTPCPSRSKLLCSFCQAKGNVFKGHVAEACTKKYDSDHPNMGNSLRQLFTAEDGEESSQ